MQNSPTFAHRFYTYAALLLSVMLAVATAPPILAQMPHISWPQSAPSRVSIATPQEPGQRLVMCGRVVDDKGRPIPGVFIEAYHTDAAGYYRADHHVPSWPGAPARLEGIVMTDGQGQYEFDTIKPGAYPNRQIPAHVHVHLRKSNGDLQEETIWFDGDPLLKPADYARYSDGGTFAQICKVTTDADGTLHCVRDFQLQP